VAFKQRVGNFLLLFGTIGLLVFVASVLTPSGSYDVSAFLVGALLFGVGLKFRMSKSSGAPHEAPRAAAPAAKAAGRPAGKGGPPKGGPPGGGPKPAGAGGSPKRQGLLASVLKGPPPKKTAPAPPRGGGGGGPPKKK
jgi:hypothetical protein